ncbi:FAD-dependent oxidoreductase [Babesia caballi]|uniref:FAD-dependent oxidoreductase n=1 Tax=Babesia caballi TaxID=5871 RepID=A0AAV4LRH5_BABCB|nr:FAD-dependent oxidoreductase [Babesia caballi]
MVWRERALQRSVKGLEAQRVIRAHFVCVARHVGDCLNPRLRSSAGDVHDQLISASLEILRLDQLHVRLLGVLNGLHGVILHLIDEFALVPHDAREFDHHLVQLLHAVFQCEHVVVLGLNVVHCVNQGTAPYDRGPRGLLEHLLRVARCHHAIEFGRVQFWVYELYLPGGTLLNSLFEGNLCILVALHCGLEVLQADIVRVAPHPRLRCRALVLFCLQRRYGNLAPRTEIVRAFDELVQLSAYIGVVVGGDCAGAEVDEGVYALCALIDLSYELADSLHIAHVLLKSFL